MGKRQKQPRISPSISPSERKQPAHAPITDWLQEKPVWLIGSLEMTGPFGWREASQEDLVRIRERLGALENSTWKEILVRDSRHNHRIQKNRLSADAQARLEEIRQADVDELVSLRITGQGRIFGILDRNSLKVLWRDPQHKACPSPKPHT